LATAKTSTTLKTSMPRQKSPSTTAPSGMPWCRSLLVLQSRQINWQTVLEHACDAESRGTPVFVELFEKSSYCAHIRAEEDGERYWSAVQKVWDTRVNGVTELVEDEAREGKEDGIEVKVEEVDVKLQALGLRGSPPVKKRCTCSDCGR
jgi:hypothetical protein